MNIEDIMWRPVKFVKSPFGFDRDSEGIIIDYEMQGRDSNHMIIEYFTINQGGYFLEDKEFLKEDEAIDSVEVHQEFSSQWKQSMIKRTLNYNNLEWGNARVIDELLDDETIREHELEQYF